MPTSKPYAIPHICELLMKTKPMSVLDIGVGFGKYGFLAREYTDIWSKRFFNWKVKIDGIEIFEKYINHFLYYIYDNIFIGDVLALLRFSDNYDFIIMADVLEHFKIKDGLLLLNKIRFARRKKAVITTPVKLSKQSAAYGNKNELHICSWSKKDLSKFGKVYQYNNTYLLEM